MVFQYSKETYFLIKSISLLLKYYLLILSKDTGCTKIDKEDLNILEDIYNRELIFGKNDPKLAQIKLGVEKC